MPRFFLAGGNMAGGIVVLSESDAEHARVLRMRVGDRLVVCDGEGKDHQCRIARLDKETVEAEVIGTEDCPAEANVRVTVLAGLPKGERADYLVQKCTELGAAEIVFFLCERCVARPAVAGLGHKLSRWQRIAEEAAKQSGRGVVPAIRAAADLGEMLDIAVHTELPLFFYETGERQPLKTVLQSAGEIRSAAVITGPEGGFEDYEAKLAAIAGARICSMGPRILRCETAPVAALAALMYETGNLD
jgi:16S rRNA (uracil1498-N3)-methyltransferase